MSGSTYQFTSADVSDIERSYKRAATAAANSSQASIKAAQALAVAEERAAKRIEVAATKAAAAKIAAGEKSAKAAQKDVERETKAIEKSVERQTKAREKAAEKSLKAAQKYAAGIEKEAEREARAIEKAAERGIKAQQRMQAARLASIGRVGGRLAFGAVAGAGGAAFSGAALALGTVGAAVREGMRAQDIANRVSINARKAGEQGVDPTILRKEFEATAIAHPGVTAEEVGHGTQKYVDLTGDLATARKMQGTFATTARASGASTEEVAEAAASMTKQFDIKGVDDMRKAMALLVAQGKEGAFPLAEAAKHLSEMGASAKRFGIQSGVEGVRQLGGLAQLARGSSGDPAEAATAVKDAMSEMLVHAKQLKAGKYGGGSVNIFDKQGNTKNIEAVLGEIISKVGGKNMGAKRVALEEVFGKRGGAMVSAPMDAYAKAYQETKANKGSDKDAEAEGLHALQKVLDDAIRVAGDWVDVQKDAAQAQESAGSQLEDAWQQIVATTTDELLPTLKEMLPSLKTAIPPVVAAFGDLAKVIAATIDALGLAAKKPGDEIVRELERKAADPTASPEDAAAFHAQANVARARDKTAEGVEVRKAAARDEFEKKWIAEGGGTLGAMADAPQIARDVEGGDGIQHKIRGWLGGNKAIENANTGQTVALADYKNKVRELGAEGVTHGTEGSGGVQVAQKGVADFGHKIGEQATALAKAATAHEKAAAAMSRAAAEMSKASGDVARSKPMGQR